MAEGVLLSVANGIAGILANPIGQEIALLWGVKGELEKLGDTVSRIHAVLLDADERQVIESHAVKDFLRKLSDAVHEADDLVDDFSTEALRREVMTRNKIAKKVRIFFSKSNQLSYRRKLAHEIKAIREKLNAIAADSKFKLDELPVKTQVIRYRARDHTHSFVPEEQVIGREDDKEAIINILLDSNVKENVSILPIIGIGGLGKTTLAQYVFNDENIKKHFEKRMWVCVSDNFDVKNIVEKILESITKKQTENLTMNTLVEHLKKEIDGKRYLLVLDDVWNEDSKEWLRLKNLLLGGARGSTIVVTTRSEKVAVITKSSHEPYPLKGLDEDKSWVLFKQNAFEKGQEPKSLEIVKIGKEIVKKCVGVPLAIRTIGSLLYFKKSEAEWLFFKNNELSKISQNENDILPTLKLSYDHLPSHLKHCFAYCRLFPKDYKIDIPKLIILWIAQGFINSSDDNKCLEDVGRDYFMDLLWGSFFQDVEKDEWGGDVKTCKMHDLMHDLAILVAGKESTILDANARNIDEKNHHVSFGFGLSLSLQIPTPLFKPSRIRTFLLPSQEDWYQDKSNMNKSTFDAIVSSFRFLRLLDMHNSGIDIIPSSISELKHLRYLDLSRNNIKTLPKSITKLQNLQTLRLSYCNKLKALPIDINKLVNLRHLEMDGCLSLTYLPFGLGQLSSLRTLSLSHCKRLTYLPFGLGQLSSLRTLSLSHCKCLTHMPRGLGQLTNLEMLSEFVVATKDSSCNGKLEELSELNKLRGELTIRILGYGRSVALESKDANLKDKGYLQALELSWYPKYVNDADVDDDEMSLDGFQPHPNLKKLSIYGYKGVKLSSWLPSLSNLVAFSLNTLNKCQYLPPLDQLPSLKILTLIYLDALEYISLSEGSSSSEELSVSSFFPSLERLTLCMCPNLTGWRRERDSVEKHHLLSLPSFPCLSSLYISDCPNLTSMPLFPFIESVNLDHANIKLLQQTLTGESPTSTITITSAPSSSSTIVSSSSAPLSNLKDLAICDIEGLESLPEDWQVLKSLQTLQLWHLRKLASLPLGLQHVTTMQELNIWKCDSLMAIPEWICNLKSLQKLEIDECPNLTSLPEGICFLTSLQKLKITNCPILSQRCKRGTGEDWPKISHIPNLEVDSSDQEEDPESDEKPTNLIKSRSLLKTLGRYCCSTS